MTTAAPLAAPRWTLTYGADLAIRIWDEDCLVHHALSNDTHRLAAWLVPALERLGVQPPASLEELAALMDADLDTAAQVLGQLQRLSLAQPC